MSTVCSKCKEIGPPPKQDDGPTGGDDYNAALEMRTTAGPSSIVQCVVVMGSWVNRANRWSPLAAGATSLAAARWGAHAVGTR
jgi:hypothetical protein